MSYHDISSAANMGEYMSALYQMKQEENTAACCQCYNCYRTGGDCVNANQDSIDEYDSDEDNVLQMLEQEEQDRREREQQEVNEARGNYALIEALFTITHT